MERLRQIRTERGYSQQELADLASVAQHTISELELGRREPQGRTLRKLANALNIQVADFFREESEVPKEEAPRSALEPSFNDVLEEERRLMETLDATARGLQQQSDLWDEKLERDVFDGAEADAALDFWTNLWDGYGDLLTREIHAMRRGESTLSKPVYDAYHQLWTVFQGTEATLREAQNRRQVAQEEPTELPRRRPSA